MSLLAIGIDSDPTMLHFLGFCRRHEIPVDAINLREIAIAGEWRMSLPSRPDDYVESAARRWQLASYDAVYTRAIDLTWQQGDSWLRNRWAGLLAAMNAWLVSTPARVVNRPHSGVHNGAKAYHEAILAQTGLHVPCSISSPDTTRLAEFSTGRAAVCKAMSGSRGESRAFVPVPGRVPPVPLHVQTRIYGRDVRCHVVGDEVIAVLVEAETVDYRAPGARPKFERWTLPTSLHEHLVAATRAFGLAFAGWDFKLSAEGQYWCLEVNPQPGYSMYDRHADWDISAALIRYLLG